MTFRTCISVHVLLAILLGATAMAQDGGDPMRQRIANGPVELVVTIDPPTSRIAEPLTLRIEVDALRGTRVSFPPWSDTLGTLSILETIQAVELPVDGKDDRRQWITTVQLESLETGAQQIPAIEIQFQLPANFEGESDSRQGVLRSEPMTIQITSVLEEQADPTKFRDIKGEEEIREDVEQRSSMSRVLAIVAAVVTFLAATGGWIWWRQRRRPTPRRWALDEVERIESEYGLQSLSVSDVYSQLSSVVREYLEAELTVSATSLSSEELENELSDHSSGRAIGDATRQRLRQFLGEADEIKFSGGADRGGDQAEVAFDSIRAIIHETNRNPQATNGRESA